MEMKDGSEHESSGTLETSRLPEQPGSELRTNLVRSQGNQRKSSLRTMKISLGCNFIGCVCVCVMKLQALDMNDLKASAGHL